MMNSEIEEGRVFLGFFSFLRLCKYTCTELGIDWKLIGMDQKQEDWPQGGWSREG